MRKFIIRTLLFALIVAATMAIGEVIVRTLPNPYKTKQKVMTEKAGQVKTLVFGDSHTYFGIRPDMLGPGAVSLANVSQTLKYDRRLFEHWLPKLDSLRTVILHVSYTSLFDPDMEQADDRVFVCNYVLYMNLKTHPWYSKYSSEIWNFNTYKNKLGVFFGLQESNLQHDSLGHGESFCLAAKYEGWEESGPRIAEKHTAGLHREMLASNLAEIERIADECRRRGIRLVFVTMPEWHTYRESIDKESFRLFTATIDSLTKARNLEWYNYWGDPRFGKDDFYDADHLTSDLGATKLTRLLRDTLATK